jgi:kelch-like protein 10
MMTGGGISKATVLISPSKNFSCTPLKNMFFPRKEHATVYLNGCVYAIGGYLILINKVKV